MNSANLRSTRKLSSLCSRFFPTSVSAAKLSASVIDIYSQNTGRKPQGLQKTPLAAAAAAHNRYVILHAYMGA